MRQICYPRVNFVSKEECSALSEASTQITEMSTFQFSNYQTQTLKSNQTQTIWVQTFKLQT